ncbi:MAG: hypothetical protein HUK08_04975 [Bacteroidaceae bacterium]|nr:hypothetical protein [Bacteroidaceae bacterium]MCF0202700.1 hypothetical protein [Bacteroidaceae bacterium]
MKRFLLAATIAATTATAWAGGLLTNTNQNVAFNRMMSREASIGIDGVYSNPAGVAFMDPGLYLSVNWQAAFQTRTVKNDYLLFQNNVNDPTTSREFKGKTSAPVIPSLQLAYNWKNWSFQLNFAISGGGGKCAFDNGLGSFERAVSNIAFGSVFQAAFKTQVATLVPGFMKQGMTQEQATVAAQQAITNSPEAMSQLTQFSLQNSKYTMNSFMEGSQYHYGLSLGAAYKFSDKLAASLGARVVFASGNYNGYVKNISVAGQQTGLEIEMNCDQSGVGITPIIGIDYRPSKHWNLSARYEFKTRMRLKNSAVNKMPDLPQVKEALAKYEDGLSIAEDIPALLTVGVGYSPIEALRLNGGFHYFWDRQATCYGNRNELLSRGTIEGSFGAEYDLSKVVTMSAGWQTTNYGLTDEYMDDKSFVVNSNSIGAGVCLHVSKLIDVNIAYFTTLYGHKNTTETDATTGLQYTSDYTRTSHSVGVGVDFHF